MNQEGTETSNGSSEAHSVLEATKPHWNDEIPGVWSKLRRLDEISSYNIGRHVTARSGVYRLVGLTGESGVIAPVTLDRVCGQDRTGTLYIGCAGNKMTLVLRLQRLVRSLSERGRSRYSTEHPAGTRLRRSSLLASKFPPSRLAITWAYHRDFKIAEDDLLLHYFECFGEAPPLNRQQPTF